ncbi:MAG: SDR family oxidoreductase [Verrucomicrobiota bacterium]
MKSWALITGASEGIGRELAKLFAADQHNLVLVARSENRLKELASELQTQHGIEVRILAKDLTTPNAAAEIFEAVSPLPVSVLVNNAGSGWHGNFATTPLPQSLTIMRLNMEAVVTLTHLFLQPMLARRDGKILTVASTAAFQPGPSVNVYYATKAFAHSFSYALGEELRGSGVTVTTLCPGTTHTEFFKRGNFSPVRNLFTMDAATVARAGYRGMQRGRRTVIPGAANKIAAAISRRLPLSWSTAIVRRLHRNAGKRTA